MMNAAHEPPESGVVLLVDDAPDNLAFLCDALEGSGYALLVALDGARALEIAASAQPDVILLDALMPGMDGFETCRRLKGDARSRDIPVIFMTGLTQTEHVLAGFAAGGIDYVTKPIEPAVLVARVGAQVGVRRRLRDAGGGEASAEPVPGVAERFGLTAREREVLDWVAKGKTNRDIAEILGMSPRTVNKHLEHVFQKLGVETRTAAASFAIRTAPARTGSGTSGEG